MAKKAKLKPHKGLKKRVRVTAKGKVVRKKAFKGHLMSTKTSERRRRLRRDAKIAPSELDRIKRLLALK